MNQESINEALDTLTEKTAQHIIFTSQPGATDDTLAAGKQLLYDYLERAQELLAQRQLAEEERATMQRQLSVMQRSVFYLESLARMATWTRWKKRKRTPACLSSARRRF